jgi:hypothetical protein
MKTDEMLKQYFTVFRNIVKEYVEEDREDPITLSEKDISKIAYNLVYGADNMWEYIYETIEYYVGKTLLERSENNG